MKTAIALMIVAASILPAAAQQKSETYSGGVTSLSAEDKKIWRGVVERAGYNCPMPGPMFDEGQDARGQIFRLHCGGGSEGKFSLWDMRIISTVDKQLKVERW